MSDREIRQMFEETDKKIVIKKQKRSEAIANLMQTADSKKEPIRVDTKKVIMNQILYMDKTMLWIQLLAELIVMLIFLKLGRLEIAREDIVAYTIIFSGMMGIFVPGGIHRSFASHMVELSETCYFNTKQMVVFQMIYAGVGSLVLLVAGSLFVGINWQVNLVQISIYMLVPYIFSCCCCLGALLTETGRRNNYTFIVVGLLVNVFFIILASNPDVYRISALIFWATALGAGVLLFAIQLKILFHHIEKGEILCMN